MSERRASDAGRSSARAVITGVVGATAVGRSAVASAAALRAGSSRFSLQRSSRIAGPHAFTISAASYLPRFDPDPGAGVTPRLTALLDLVTAQLQLDPALAATRALPVFLGAPSPRPGLAEDAVRAAVAAVGEALAAKGFAPAIEVLPLDHAAGLAGLRAAVSRIEDGSAGVCLVGGVDSYLAGETLAWLHERGQLKSEHHRWGFVPGEGAGWLVVTSPDVASAAGLTPIASVLAAATGHERVPPRTADPQTGEGLTAALRGALEGLDREQVVDEMVCDLNGERWRGDEAGFSIPRVADRVPSAGRYVAPAVAFGDLGAATGPLAVAVAVHAAQRGISRGPTALAWTSSDNGPRSAALLSIPIRERE